MQIALISDLHGNEIALEAVLRDIERRGIEQIACLGDVATLGPRPTAVLARLRALGCPVILGNHDAFMLDPELIHTYSEIPIILDAVAWCRAQLSEEDLAFVRTFLPLLTVPLEGGSTLLLFHGTPRSNMVDMLATTPAAELDAMLEGHSATVMAAGHTHIQMVRQHRGTLLVNPGSVGLPFKEYVEGREPTLMPYAEYATIEATEGTVSVALRRVALDKASLREAALASDNPMRDSLAGHYS